MLYAFDRVLARTAAVAMPCCSRRRSCCRRCAATTCWSSRPTRSCVAVRSDGASSTPQRPDAAARSPACISVVALAPFLWPYYLVSRDHGLVRDVSDVTQYNAGWRDYLVTGGRLHYAWWSHGSTKGERRCFPASRRSCSPRSRWFRGRGDRAIRACAWRSRSACSASLSHSARRCRDMPSCTRRCRS